LEIIANPDASGANTSATVASFTARMTGQPFAGVESMHGADIGTFTLDATTSQIRMMVWKSTISNVGIKLVESNNAALPEILVPNTVVNQWEELVFDFSAMEGIEYDQIVVFPDFTDGPRMQENVVYFDNISFNENTLMPVSGCTNPEATNYDQTALTSIQYMLLVHLLTGVEIVFHFQMMIWMGYGQVLMKVSRRILSTNMR